MGVMCSFFWHILGRFARFDHRKGHEVRVDVFWCIFRRIASGLKKACCILHISSLRDSTIGTRGQISHFSRPNFIFEKRKQAWIFYFSISGEKFFAHKRAMTSSGVPTVRSCAPPPLPPPAIERLRVRLVFLRILYPKAHA